MRARASDLLLSSAAWLHADTAACAYTCVICAYTCVIGGGISLCVYMCYRLCVYMCYMCGLAAR
jgi:hypothetical protein